MAKPQRVTYFKAALDDKPGALLTVAKNLKAANLGLLGLWGMATQPGKADLYVVAKNPQKLRDAWKKSGLLAEEGVGFLLKGTDKTGALLKTLEAVAKAGINIVAMDGIAVAGKYGAFIWVMPADVEAVAKVLGAK